MKYSIIGIILISILFVVLILVGRNNTFSKNLEPLPEADTAVVARTSFATYAESMGISDLTIEPNEYVDGSVTITGKAAGYFFEGTFPVEITTPTNQSVLNSYATATSDWMVDEPVPFTVTIDFDTLPAGQLSLWLRQEDPSDGESGREPRQLEIPVYNR
jgi:hypothetical protein